MRNGMNLARLALSQENVSLVDEVPVEDIVVQSTDTVQDEEINVIEATQEVEEHVNAVEVLDTAATSLEALICSMEEILEEGEEAALEPQAAQFIEQQVEQVAETVGLVDEEVPAVVASQEAFAADKRRASLESFEKVGDFLSKIWKAIRDAAIRAFGVVMNFFASIFGGVSKVRARTLELQKRARGVSDGVAEKFNFRSTNRLKLAGQFNAGAVISGLKNTETVGTEVFGAYAANLPKLYAKLGACAVQYAKEGAEEASIGDSAEVSDIIMTMNNMKNLAISGDFHFTDGKAPEKNANTSLAMLATARWGCPSLTPVDEKAVRIEEVAEIEPLKKGEIDQVLAHVLAISKVLDKQKGTSIEALNAAAADFRKKLDEAVQGFEKKGQTAKYIDRIKIQGAMRLGTKSWTRPVVQFSSHAFGIMRAALVLAERSIAAREKAASAA